MPKGNRSNKAVAEGLIATVEACRAVVAAFADGRLEPVLPDGTRNADLRFAPHFSRDLPSDTPGAKYTTGSIVTYLLDLGKDTRVNITARRTAPSRWMLLAMALLEAWEEGWLDEESTLAFIHEGHPGYRLNPLLAELRVRRQAHKLLTATPDSYRGTHRCL